MVLVFYWRTELFAVQYSIIFYFCILMIQQSIKSHEKKCNHFKFSYYNNKLLDEYDKAKLHTSKTSLYGYWSLEGVTWLKITSDSIYFVDEEVTSPIKYSVNKDTIIWYLDGIIQKSIYNCTLSNKRHSCKQSYLRL